ncbi:MAG: DNA polymerase III subunit gamma/tau [Bacteroidales bacterium]|nr:DNA polymerase III subunit gamma/tau [Bacteroidales bacterium]
MEQYIVSARKYRPDSFETLIGQDNIAKTLKNSIVRGQLAHAYLFCGPRGVGKTSAARIFAKTINCEHPGPDMEPCGQCESCISFKEGRSYCIHELDAASNNSVDDIKMLIDQVNIPPQIGKYSVFIVDEVHMLSQAAFNAFLKTLEEPPAHAIFILATTEKHKILPTILSRCQTYDFNRISVPDIVRNLKDIAAKEGVSIDDESLHIIAIKADGAMRDALTIFDQTVAFCGTNVQYADVLRNLNVLDYDHCFHLVEDFLAGNHEAALLRFDDILSKGFNALHFVGSLSSHLRDLIVAKSGGLRALLELPDSLIERYKEQASRCSLRFLYEALGITTACEAGYKASINPRLHIEFTLMRLCALSGGLRDSTAAPTQAAPAASAASASPAKEEGAVVGSVSFTTTVPSDAKPAAEAPAKPRRAAKAPGALSLSALKKANAEETPVAAATSAAEDRIPTDEEVSEKWKALAGNYSDRPRLYNTLAAAKLETAEEDGVKKIVFFVTNVAQKDWIREKLLKELDNKLRGLLGTGKILLDIDVTPDEEVKQQSYTPREQAQELMQANPEIRNLVSDMGLDA